MKILFLILTVSFSTFLNAQDLRDHLVGKYVGYKIIRGAGSGNVIDTMYAHYTSYLIKSTTSDSLHMKRYLSDSHLIGRFVVHEDTSFSEFYWDEGKPFHPSNYHGYKITNDSLFYSEMMPGGGGGGEPHLHEFYGKKTDWIGIDENKLVDEISLYPNPFNHELNIKSTQEIEQVLVRNLEGKTQLSLSPKLKAFKLPLSQLNKGVYFMELHTSNGFVLKKVLKK